MTIYLQEPACSFSFGRFYMAFLPYGKMSYGFFCFAS